MVAEERRPVGGSGGGSAAAGAGEPGRAAVGPNGAARATESMCAFEQGSAAWGRLDGAEKSEGGYTFAEEKNGKRVAPELPASSREQGKNACIKWSGVCVTSKERLNYIRGQNSVFPGQCLEHPRQQCSNR